MVHDLNWDSSDSSETPPEKSDSSESLSKLNTIEEGQSPSSSDPWSPQAGDFVISDAAHALNEPENLSPESELSPSLDPSPSEEDSSPLSEVKKFTENMTTAQPVPASFPFSLLITGPLTPEEREKLVDILTRENMGIREVELEPQFASGRILIPRISEYAGVLLAQALRGTRAELKLGPSDSIFSTAETRNDPFESREELRAELGPADTSRAPFHSRFRANDQRHPAESIRISVDPTIPDLPDAVLIDLVVASTTLRSDAVEARDSPKYQETLDALIRELKYKAHHKGASAIVQFAIELTPLSLPSQYRLTVRGSAVSTSGSAATD